MKKVASVLVVAAGRGTRAQTDVPKQYVEIAGKPILRHTLDRFLSIPEIDQITVVIAKTDGAAYAKAIDGITDTRLTASVFGGDTRAQSVRAGLEAIADHAPPEHVLIHDGARPFVSRESIAQVLQILTVHDGAIVAVPAIDAVWRADGGFAISPQDRSVLWHAQTPQGFRFSRILEAHRNFTGVALDDAAVARTVGMLVQIVPGTQENYKITTPADITRARAFLEFENPSSD